MNGSNLALKYSTEEWNLPVWNYLVNEISRTFSLSEHDKEKLSNSITAKIIATIPFAANCIEPERTAIAHLILYIAELKGFQKYCAHLPSDDKDIYNRLAFVSTFEGGDPQVLDYGMNILALIMLEGYKKSSNKDKNNNVYNPLVSKAWNYQSIKNKILSKLAKTQVPLLDSLVYTPSMFAGGW